MARRISRCAAGMFCVLTVLACVSPARAGLVNGDFSAGLDPWSLDLGSEPQSQAEVVSSFGSNTTPLAHLHAQSDFAFSDGYWDGDTNWATITQSFVTGPGETRVTFDAVLANVGLADADATVSYMAFGGGGGAASVSVGEDWRHVELPLLNAMGQSVAPGTFVLVSVTVRANAPVLDGEEGQQASQTIDGYFDNFEVVPEPATLSLLVAGGLALLRRRR